MSVRDPLPRSPRQRATRPAPSLQVVPTPAFRPPRMPFVLLVLAVLGVGLVGLLVLNTQLQQGSFVQHDLQRENSRLVDRQTTLQQRVATLAAPSTLAEKARAQRMVPNENPAYLRLSDGKVAGKGEPAKASQAPNIPIPPADPPGGSDASEESSSGSSTQPSTGSSAGAGTGSSTGRGEPNPSTQQHSAEMGVAGGAASPPEGSGADADRAEAPEGQRMDERSDRPEQGSQEGSGPSEDQPGAGGTR